MDDFKPEDDMKADRNDRRAGRSRQSSERDADPQINFDDVDLDADEGRPTRAGKARREREEEEFEEELDAQDEAIAAALQRVMGCGNHTHQAGWHVCDRCLG